MNNGNKNYLSVIAAAVLMLAAASAAHATATYDIVYYAPGGAPGVTVTSGGTYYLGVYKAHSSVIAGFQVNNTSATESLNVSAASCPGTSVLSVVGGGITLPPGAGSSIDVDLSSTPNGPVNGGCTLSFSVGSTPFTAAVSITVLTATQTIDGWWNANSIFMPQCSDTYLFPTTPVGTPESQVLDVANANDSPITVDSVTVVSNEDCFFVLSAPATIQAHRNGQVRLRLLASEAVSCVGLLTVASSDPTLPNYAFFVNGFVGSAPYAYTPLTATCPSN